MKVNSHNIEFGYELLSAIPYAYELHLAGLLSETESGWGSDPLYYFSPKHTINSQKRSWFNTSKARSSGLKYVNIHSPELQPKVFPPYAQHYANNVYKWDKPTLCICNRANIEWEHSIINYFDATILHWMFANLKDKYEIIYFPIQIPESIQDNGTPVQVINDIKVAHAHGVTVFTDLLKGAKWNDVILRVFANCKHYITMNGGYSILASYFQGQNIIYSKPGTPQTKELTTGAFWRYYPNINNVQTLHVPDYDQLKEKIKALYIDNLPTANVIIRTSGRPNAFRNAVNSVFRQDYPNINIVVTADDQRSIEYTREYRVRLIPVKPSESRPKPDNSDNYGVWFPFNEYINQAQQGLNGYIFFLDDDDHFLDNSAISKVISQMKPDKLAIWRVQFPDRVIPNGTFGVRPTLYDVTGIGMCYHSTMMHKSDWSPWKKADYRTAALWKDNEIVWINEVLTGLQNVPGFGRRNDVRPKKVIDMKLKGKVKVQFTRRYQDYLPGQVVMLDAIIASNYIYRNFCTLVTEREPEKVIESNSEQEIVLTNNDNGVMGLQQKEEKTVYQTKVRKPRKTTKANETEN
jgi:glycosyltransferase involved in cell wall biosynthesis